MSFCLYVLLGAPPFFLSLALFMRCVFGAGHWGMRCSLLFGLALFSVLRKCCIGVQGAVSLARRGAFQVARLWFALTVRGFPALAPRCPCEAVGEGAGLAPCSLLGGSRALGIGAFPPFLPVVRRSLLYCKSRYVIWPCRYPSGGQTSLWRFKLIVCSATVCFVRTEKGVLGGLLPLPSCCPPLFALSDRGFCARRAAKPVALHIAALLPCLVADAHNGAGGKANTVPVPSFFGLFWGYLAFCRVRDR